MPLRNRPQIHSLGVSRAKNSSLSLRAVVQRVKDCGQLPPEVSQREPCSLHVYEGRYHSAEIAIKARVSAQAGVPRNQPSPQQLE